MRIYLIISVHDLNIIINRIKSKLLGLAVQSDYNSQSSENRDQDTQKSAKSKSRPPTEISKNRINQSESNDENCEETNNCKLRVLLILNLFFLT